MVFDGDGGAVYGGHCGYVAYLARMRRGFCCTISTSRRHHGRYAASAFFCLDGMLVLLVPPGVGHGDVWSFVCRCCCESRWDECCLFWEFCCSSLVLLCCFAVCCVSFLFIGGISTKIIPGILHKTFVLCRLHARLLIRGLMPRVHNIMHAWEDGHPGSFSSCSMLNTGY